MSNIYFTFLWSVCYLWCVCWKYGSFRFPGLQCCNRWPWWCRNWTRFFSAAPGILYSKWFFCVFGDLVLSQSDRLVKTRFQRLHVLFRKCVGVVCCIFHHSILSKFIIAHLPMRKTRFCNCVHNMMCSEITVCTNHTKEPSFSERMISKGQGFCLFCVWYWKVLNLLHLKSLRLESRSRKSAHLFRGSVRFQLCVYFRARDCTIFTLQNLNDFFVERVTVHRIKRNDHSCFHNLWPNSKTKLKWKHLWEQGALVFQRPYAACVFCSGSALIVIIFNNIFLCFWLNKCSLDEHKIFFSRTLKRFTDFKLLNSRVEITLTCQEC